MIGEKEELTHDVRSLLEHERRIAVPPAYAQARAVSRARAALVAGVATRQVSSRAPSAARWAAAAGLACLATVATGAAAYTIGARARPTAPAGAAALPVESFAPHQTARDQPMLDLGRAPAVERKPGRSQAAVGRAELGLLQQARAAVAHEDFLLAIQLLAEHARHFKAGRLVEEREALRVRSLVGLGRRDAARRAAGDFEANFPRSPLLPTVNEMLDADASTRR